ncbi:MAG: shikimate dehydrogenase [Tissierellia bacterium]|nr:shikimate dehydrogenase [Tissierellia bacterium]
MEINWETRLFCLIGHPVSKSLSPNIHNEFYKINNLNNVYLVFDIKEDNIENIIQSFKAMNIQGFNITIPYKIKIMDYLDEISKEAKLIGAVNTVKNENGKLIGYNTDGLGFMKSLEGNNINVKNKNILILGSGGAANAISTSLALADVKKLYINNRNIDNSRKLVMKIGRQFPNINIEYGDLSLNNVKKEEIHMVINCTSVGMYPNIEEIPISLEEFPKNLIVYDIIYKPRKTNFLEMAEERGYYTINGLSMLINQGLYSQSIWLDENFKNIFKNFEEIRRTLEIYVE